MFKKHSYDLVNTLCIVTIISLVHNVIVTVIVDGFLTDEKNWQRLPVIDSMQRLKISTCIKYCALLTLVLNASERMHETDRERERQMRCGRQGSSKQHLRLSLHM